MSKQSVQAFRAAVAADPALAEQVKGTGGDPAALLALAQARGFEFTREEADEVLNEGELSELELELVAGGIERGAVAS